MFSAKIKFKCILCGQSKSWYLSPLDEKAGDSYIHSKTCYRVICKKCGADYILKFTIKLLKRKK